MEAEHLKKLLEICIQNLHLLEERKAMYGPLEVPVALLNEIEELRKEIGKLKAQLAAMEQGGRVPPAPPVPIMDGQPRTQVKPRLQAIPLLILISAIVVVGALVVVWIGPNLSKRTEATPRPTIPLIPPAPTAATLLLGPTPTTTMPPLAPTSTATAQPTATPPVVGGQIAFSESPVPCRLGQICFATKGMVDCLGICGSDPDWSPDGHHIALWSTDGQNGQIYIIEVASRRWISLTTRTDLLEQYPAWSPDGERLAFTSNRDGNAELYVLDLPKGRVPGGGTVEARRLTDNPGLDRFPDWSPDGTYLAFASQHQQGAGLYLIEVDNPNPEQTRRWLAEGLIYYPVWSPQGDQIAYVRPGGELCVIEVTAAMEGGQPRCRAFAVEVVSNGGLAWSPDGRQIAFVAMDEAKKPELYVVEAQDGEEPAKLLGSGEGCRQSPSWIQ